MAGAADLPARGYDARSSAWRLRLHQKSAAPTISRRTIHRPHEDASASTTQKAETNVPALRPVPPLFFGLSGQSLQASSRARTSPLLPVEPYGSRVLLAHASARNDDLVPLELIIKWFRAGLLEGADEGKPPEKRTHQSRLKRAPLSRAAGRRTAAFVSIAPAAESEHFLPIGRGPRLPSVEQQAAKNLRPSRPCRARSSAPAIPRGGEPVQSLSCSRKRASSVGSKVAIGQGASRQREIIGPLQR
jgi:hypothetical protein